MTTERQKSSLGNSVEVSLFDVYTTTYFLAAHTITEEHKEAGDPE